MIRILIAIATLLLAACGGASQQAPTTISEAPQYVWTKLLDSAPWKKTYNYQLFSFRDTLWAFHPDGAWLSHNGINWVPSGLADTIGNQAFLSYVQSDDTILGLGHFEGNIDQYRFTSSIYRTTDCRNWQVLSAQSNLPPRFFYHPFVFNQQYWIMGGEDRSRRYADCWRSTDGIHWAKLKDSLPFGPRSNSQVVQFKGKLYLLDNDVWSSADGLTWQRETDAIVKGEEVFGYAALVFDERIWLLGCNRNGLFTSEVLVSQDGKNWQPQEAPWLPRGGIAATVHRGKVYMTGGKYGGTPNHPQFRYDNDVWVMEKKP